jgi:LysR family glycine cleavage system transcriptional activator
MAERLPPLNALKVFESAARHLSLKRAAQELNVTPAAVSHQVKLLENYLGVQLFRRLNRGLELTPAARAALPQLSAGFDSLAQAAVAMRPQPDTGKLTISAAPSFATRWLVPRLHRFFSAHPEIDVGVSARLRRAKQGAADSDVERATLENWLQESDVAILYGHGGYDGYRADKLFAPKIAPICSPRLMEGELPLRRPQDLMHHALIHDDTGMLFDGAAFWDVWLKASGVDGIDTRRGSHFSHAVLAIEAAADSLGVVATVPLLAASELAAGRLVMPFELQVPLRSAYYAVSNDLAGQRPAVAAFRDWLLAEAAESEKRHAPVGASSITGRAPTGG